MANEWLSQRAFVLQSASNVGKPCPNNTSWSDFTSNLTHLHLESKGLRLISNLESCYAVRVLYLYNNRIDSISGLENLRQLTHLYLQVCGPLHSATYTCMQQHRTGTMLVLYAVSAWQVHALFPAEKPDTED